MGSELLKRIPQISKIVNRFKSIYGEEEIKKAARNITEQYRTAILSGKNVDINNIYRDIEKEINMLKATNIKRVINATGIVINTNLGRSPMPRKALDFIKEISSGYSNLEFDLKKGQRGSRQEHIQTYLRDLTGAESALVVNNNAGAVLLVLNSIAKGKEVVVSRGELVEIGGSFRIPDIMELSGAVIREVGTTNRTSKEDYINAVNENTALFMKVHRSNFHIKGFTQEVRIEELASIGKDLSIPTYYDAGSGSIIETEDLGIVSGEKSFRKCVEAGIDIVSGSGDKLLGGPQAGIIVGKEAFIRKMKENPLYRVLRIDKMCLAGLEITLKMYLNKSTKNIHVLNMLTLNEHHLKKRAKRLARMLKQVKNLNTIVTRDHAYAGGGSMPEVVLPTYCVRITHHELSPERLLEILRRLEPPVIGRIKKDAVLLDVRTISDDDFKILRTLIKPLSELLQE